MDAPYYTGGTRAVFLIATRPTALDRVEFLDWEWPHE